ncbi:MAG TPA: hypothetical protein VEQ41_08670 [Solirubrobacterales bacterium]|nr:hypothetical protein [Solirubrobacterales bacterium]
MIYHAIGKAVVKYGWLFMRRRYARPMKVAAGVGAVGLGVALYYAARDVPEG